MIGMLHQGGWDEVILLGGALLVGMAIVFLGGKKKPPPPDAPTDEEAELIAQALDDLRRSEASVETKTAGGDEVQPRSHPADERAEPGKNGSLGTDRR